MKKTGCFGRPTKLYRWNLPLLRLLLHEKSSDNNKKATAVIKKETKLRIKLILNTR